MLFEVLLLSTVKLTGLVVLSLQVTDTPGLLKRPDGNDIVHFFSSKKNLMVSFYR